MQGGRNDCEIRENKKDGKDELKNALHPFVDPENMIRKIQNYLKEKVYQTQHVVLRERIRGTFKIEIAESDDIDVIKEKLEKEKKVFFWTSGDLEDMLCTSILESDAEEMEKMEMLFDLFLLHGNNIALKTKKNKKSSIPILDENKVCRLCQCLLNSEEINIMFNFLLRVADSQNYV